MTEEELVDPLEQFIEDVESVALDIRESRAMSSNDIQKAFALDFFPLLHKLGVEVLERDMDHEARVKRLESALGLGEMEEDETSQWLEADAPTSVLTPTALAETLVLARAVAEEVGGLEEASEGLKERAAMLSTVSTEALKGAVEEQQEPAEELVEEEEEDEEPEPPEEPAEEETEEE